MGTNPVGSANWEARRKGKGPAPGQYDRDLNAPLHMTGGRMAHGSRWQVNVYIYTQTSVGGFVYVLCVCVCLYVTEMRSCTCLEAKWRTEVGGR